MAAVERHISIHRETDQAIVNLADEVLRSWEQEPHPSRSRNGVHPNETNTIENPFLALRNFDLGIALGDARQRITTFIDGLNLQPGQLVRDERTNSVVGLGKNNEYLVNDGRGNQLAINADGTVVYKDAITGYSVVEDVDERHSLSSGSDRAHHEVVLDDRLRIARDERGIYVTGEDGTKNYLSDRSAASRIQSLGLRRDESTGRWSTADGWLEIDPATQQLTVPGDHNNPIVLDFNTSEIAIGTGDERIVFNADGTIDFYDATISCFGESITYSEQAESIEESRLEQQIEAKVSQVYAQISAIIDESKCGRPTALRIATLTVLCGELARLIDIAKPFPELATVAQLAFMTATCALASAQSKPTNCGWQAPSDGESWRRRSSAFPGLSQTPDGIIRIQPLDYSQYSHR